MTIKCDVSIKDNVSSCPYLDQVLCIDGVIIGIPVSSGVRGAQCDFAMWYNGNLDNGTDLGVFLKTDSEYLGN